MAIQDILVHVDDSKSALNRIRLSAAIAAAHGAHLTGCYRTPDIDLGSHVATWYYMPDSELRALRKTVDELRATRDSQSQAAEDRFMNLLEAAGVTGEWRASADPYWRQTAGAQYADLIVAGQGEPGARGTSLAELFLVDSGRPVLVVPHLGEEIEKAPERILVAWNESREAARAVHDAMPLLVNAAEVFVVTVGDEPEDASRETALGVALGHHLARHDVKATAHHITEDEMAVTDVLLSRATELGAELIVMGAYGHSRLRETVLGGATREMLREMTVPVLMSH